MSAADAEDRFWRKVAIPADATKCWTWTGGTTVAGYGQMSVQYRKVLVHRFVYELAVGAIPPGMEIDHLCHVRNCVNPAHLDVVTHAENMARIQARPQCNNGHDMTGDNLIRRADTGYRMCKACRDQRNRAAYLRRKYPKP